MSSHESIAAQFWLWPDPVMKRDAQGRILFINAAFLQLYGGTVEAWTGNVLQGWPAPQPTEPGAYPVPYRFETRMPAQEAGQTEQVYDWVEQSHPDGSAFALARNVTSYASAAQPILSDAPPPVETPVAQSSSEQPQPSSLGIAQDQIQAEDESLPQQEPQQDMSAASHDMQTAYDPVASEATLETEASFEPQSQEPNAPQADVETASEINDTAPEQAQIDDAQSVSSNAPEQEASPDPVSAEHTPDQTQQVQAQQSPAEEEKRDFERRALPLEDDSAVLGNNWRDAVIAKALGVEDAPAQQTAPATAETEAQSAPSAETGELSGGVKRILLAEDNAINALLTRTLLEAEGHVVETVEDGTLAVEAMKSQSYDLIFMDMRMPNMDGLEATRKIRSLPNVPKGLPIIALTANAFDDDRNACFDSGMNDFMTKPVSAEELTQMVKNWTGEKAEKDAA
ncbi:response regulator [Litorimonas haliclonae]|uniref:response regulator n=1 Tax=Litorimonas haliclonae TaxID=2081977 RepID=UPI0039F14C56